MFKITISTVLATWTLAVAISGQTTVAVKQAPVPTSGSVNLLSRYKDDRTGDDNYVDAAYSFEKATNGVKSLKVTRNDWDLLFSTLRYTDGRVRKDIFDV